MIFVILFFKKKKLCCNYLIKNIQKFIYLYMKNKLK